MPRKAIWVGRDLWNLLNLPMTELQSMYVGYTRDTLKGKRAYWKKQLKQGKITMPNPERETVTEEVVDGKLVSSIEGWYEVVTKDAAGEAHVHRLYKHSTKSRPTYDGTEAFEPAQPAKITPSRRKSVTRPYKTLFVFSDAQIDYRRNEDGELDPIHDERCLTVARLICRDVRPEYIINLGDTVDLASLSRFKPDSDHFHRTLGHAFQRTHDMYAQYRSDNPDAKIIEVDSNHNTRLKDFMLKNAPQFYGMKRAGDTKSDYPFLTYPYLANLGHVGVEWISGYGAAEYVYGQDYADEMGNMLPPIVFKHGSTMVSAGSTANKESKDNAEVHVVRGHGHRMEAHTRTNRAGQYLASIMLGALCRTDGAVPSYHSGVDDRGNVVKKQENWQTGVLVIYDYGGRYQFDNIMIQHGKAFYNGVEYDGNE